MLDDAPLIVTLTLDALSQERLDAWRQRYFPAGRNHLAAHLTLFHALPGSEQDEVTAVLAREAAAMAPPAVRWGRLARMARGVMVVAEAPEVRALHGRLAQAFAPWLTAQDRQKLAPHVTVMNKATPDEASEVMAELSASFVPWQGRGEGLALWSYAGGPWVARGSFALGGT